MINDFLKKYQEELISEKIQLKEDMDLLETKIKEETKFLSLLEESNESYFKEFTPRDINSKNNEKANEIRENLRVLNSQMNDKVSRMKFFDSRLLELNALISNNVIINRPAVKTDETMNSNSVNAELISNLESIKKTIVLDPYKAQIDLDNLINRLNQD